MSFIPIRHLVLLPGILLLLISCSKTPDDHHPEEYLPLQGKWEGITSELTHLELEIDRIHRSLKIKSLRFSHRSDTGLRFQELTDEHGLAWVENKHFTIALPDLGQLTGLFSDTNLLKGSIRVLDEHYSYKLLTYSATPTNGKVSVHSVALAGFTARGISYLYRQEINNLFTHPVLRISDRGIITETGIRIEKGQYKNQLVFAFRVGIFRENFSLQQYFLPGLKPFASMDEGGLEIIFYDPELYYEQWSSAWGCRDQQGSYFRILAIDSLPSARHDVKRLKLLAEFSCKVYGVRGDTLLVNDGKFVGVIDIPR